LHDSISQSLDWKILRSSEPALGLAEGARFELAVHEVDAGFQDRWFQPLTHPSDKDFNYLWWVAFFCVSIRVSICEVPKALATSSSSMSRYRS
jgi:hypothetical protein